MAPLAKWVTKSQGVSLYGRLAGHDCTTDCRACKCCQPPSCSHHPAETKVHLLQFANTPATWALLLAVGSYSENRSSTQGAAQSTGGADGDDEPNKKYWFLNIKRYRRFFNVDTEVQFVKTCDGVLIQPRLDTCSIIFTRHSTRFNQNFLCDTCCTDWQLQSFSGPKAEDCQPARVFAGHPYQNQGLCDWVVQGRFL